LLADSVKRPRRGRVFPDSPLHGFSMRQETGKKEADAVDLQTTIPEPDRLLVLSIYLHCPKALKKTGHSPPESDFSSLQSSNSLIIKNKP
jgi:hypothetical protein